MILADKIIEQRKKLGLSQEELADKLGVSRQAVSKWEGAQSTPDLGRILALGQLFGVSTDYLLKDDVGQAEYIDIPDDSEPVRRVSMAEASAFLHLKEELSHKISAAILMCILSPVCLLLLSAASEAGMMGLSENAAGAIGIIVLLLIVGAAVAIFLSCGMKSRPYEYLEKESFETDYGVVGMVRERQSQYQTIYTRKLVIGVCTCIFSVVPLLIAAFATENEFVIVSMVAALLIIAGIGVFQLVSSGVRWGSMEQLLQEGDYTKKKKKSATFTEAVAGAYWMLAVAVYLGYSFTTGAWDRSWIVWPVAGVLFGAAMALWGAFDKNR